MRFFAKFSFFSKIFFFNFFSKNSFLSIFSSFYLILALMPSKCQKFVILFKKDLKRGNSLSFSHQNKQISVLVYFLGFQRKYSWIFGSKPQIFEIFQKTSMSGANACGNERVWSENQFSLKSSKHHGGMLPA